VTKKINEISFEEEMLVLVTGFNWDKESNLIVNCIDFETGAVFLFLVEKGTSVYDKDPNFNFINYQENEFKNEQCLFVQLKKYASGYLYCVSGSIYKVDDMPHSTWQKIPFDFNGTKPSSNPNIKYGNESIPETPPPFVSRGSDDI